MSSARRRPRAGRLTRLPWIGPLAWLVTASMLAPSLAPRVAYAADPPAKTTPETAAAHQHATRAHELYQEGQYHEAIAELETALKLDPNGKELIFNLGVVHEKLGDIEDALRYFQRYEQMDPDAADRAKADTYLKRLQGARKEVEKPPETVTVIQSPPPPAPPPIEVHYGRFDWLTAGTAVIGVGGLAVGAIFGVKAIGDRPTTSSPTTDSNGYAQVQAAEQNAHREAITSDISFAVGIAGVAATAVLFFARTRDSASPQAGRAVTAGPVAGSIVVSGTPLRGGGAFFLGARF